MLATIAVDCRVLFATGPGKLQVRHIRNARKLEGQNGARRYRPRSTVAQSACVPAHVPNSEVTGNLPESQRAFNLRSS